jgi:Integral membrane protein, interacts with FtsH
MADFETNRGVFSTRTDAGAYDAGLRKYMLRVYNLMFLALVVTGATAYFVFNMAVGVDPETGRLGLTGIGQTLFLSPLKWVVIFAPLGMVLFINMRLNRMSVAGAQAAFWIFSGLIGLSMASIFLLYTAMSIAQVFFITAAAFGALSLYGYTTSKSLSGIGSFLFMGVIGLIIASLVNIFLHSSMMSWVISVAGVGIFAGLTAYDTQRIKEMYYQVGGNEAVAGKMAILGALALYLDFINMFQFLLSLMGNRR